MLIKFGSKGIYKGFDLTFVLQYMVTRFPVHRPVPDGHRSKIIILPCALGVLTNRWDPSFLCRSAPATWCHEGVMPWKSFLHQLSFTMGTIGPRLFFYQAVRTYNIENIKSPIENIKAPNHWPLRGEFNDDSPHKGPVIPEMFLCHWRGKL